MRIVRRLAAKRAAAANRITISAIVPSTIHSSIQQPERHIGVVFVRRIERIVRMIVICRIEGIIRTVLVGRIAPVACLMLRGGVEDVVASQEPPALCRLKTCKNFS